MVFPRPRRAEDRHGGMGDVCDGVEAVEELVRDAVDVRPLGMRAVDRSRVGHEVMVLRTRFGMTNEFWLKLDALAADTAP